MTGAAVPAIPPLVEHLFRRESARLVAALVRGLGPRRLDLAEEVVQEALLKALQIWPYRGVPEDPQAWLVTVARRTALDRLRRDRRFDEITARAVETLYGDRDSPGADDGTRFAREIEDDILRLMFLCCHPNLSPDARAALTLKNVGGFGVGEIARAFLSTESTIAQRLVRARRTIHERDLRFDIEPAEMDARLDSVLEVIYLIFNEGYAAHAGADLIRSDFVREAMRLGRLLASHPAGNRPAAHALLALMHFQAARLPARLDSKGRLALLADQDRTLWDRGEIAQALVALERASAGSDETVYHLQAAIGACHAVAGDDKGTDWERILELYDRLLERNPSPVVELNRAVALARVRGPASGLRAIRRIESDPRLARYYLLHATRADLLLRLNRPAEAAAALRAALECSASEPERRFLEARLHECEHRTAHDSPPSP